MTTRYPFFSVVTADMTPSEEKVQMFSIGSKVGIIANLFKNFYMHFAIGLGVNAVSYHNINHDPFPSQSNENARGTTPLLIIHGNFLYAF